MARSPTVDEVRVSLRVARDRSRAAWKALGREIERCRRCSLGFLRTHVAIHRGGLRPRVLFVGEAPGRKEDLQGVPFVGPAGRRLDGAIASLGLRPSDVAVVNVIKCRPPDNRFDPEAARACRPFLTRQVLFLRPRAVVPLGRRALEAFRPDALPITTAAGKRLRWRGRLLFPMVHPAAPMHSKRFARRWERDLRSLGKALRAEDLL